MASLELNKVFGALLGTGLFVMSVGIVSGAVFSTHKPEKPGYDLPSAEAAGGAGAGAAPAAAKEPLPVLLAKADAKKGESLVKACVACHAFDKGGANKVGPALYNTVGAPKASHAGFSYSDALKGKGGNWTFEDLDAFIANPKGFAPGTKMAFGGEKDAGRRADILAYMRSLSDNPVPLPAAEAAKQ